MHERRSADGRWSDRFCSNIPAEPASQKNGGFYRFRRPQGPVSSFHARWLGGVGQPFGETAAAACFAAPANYGFPHCGHYQKYPALERDQPKSRSSGRGGELCLGSRHRSQKPQPSKQVASWNQTVESRHLIVVHACVRATAWLCFLDFGHPWLHS